MERDTSHPVMKMRPRGKKLPPMKPKPTAPTAQQPPYGLNFNK